MHNMYIIGKKAGLNFSLLRANNRSFILHIIVSGAQINHIYFVSIHDTHTSVTVWNIFMKFYSNVNYM